MFEIVEAFLKCRASTIKVCTWTCGPRNLSLGCDCVERGRAVHILWKEAGKGASLKWDIYGCLEMLSHLSRKAGENGTSSSGKLEKNRRPAAMPREGNILKKCICIYIYVVDINIWWNGGSVIQWLNQYIYIYTNIHMVK